MKILGSLRRVSLFLSGILILNGFSSLPTNANLVAVPQEPTITRIVRNVDRPSALMTFTAPPLNFGPAITDYEYSINGGTTWQSVGISTPAMGNSTPRTITISTFGARDIYDVVLRARNSNGAGIISPVFNTGLTAATVVGSVLPVPFAGEGAASAVFNINLAGVNADDSATTRFRLSSQPSGSNAEISQISASNGDLGGEVNSLTLTTSVVAGGGVYKGTATVQVDIQNTGGLVEGTYTLTATPSAVMTQLGARVQTIRFAVTSRSQDGPRLESINTVAAISNTNLKGETQKVFVGARVQLPNAEGSIRLRADLISYPDGGYVKVISGVGSTSLGSSNHFVGTDASLITIVGSFSGCTIDESNDLGNCDSVTATQGTLSPTQAGTGIASFLFTPTVAGSYTMRVWQDSNNNGITDLSEAFNNVVVSIQNYPGVSAKDSRIVINRESGFKNFFGDEYVLVPIGPDIQKVARIKVSLNSIVTNRVNGQSEVIRMDSRATFPTIRADIKGPGLITISESGGADKPVGRDLIYSIASAPTNESARNEFFIEVWNDGTNGVGVVTVYLDEVAWQSKSVSFYGAPSKVRVSQNLRVAPAGVPGTFNAAVLLVTDSAEVPVPGMKLSAKSSDSSLVLDDVNPIDFGNGSYGTTLTALSVTKSGQAVTIMYTATVGTVAVTSDEAVYKFGEKPFTAEIRISAAPGVGEQSFISFAAKDAFGNAPFDAFHPFTLSSSVSITSSIGGVGDLPLAGTLHIFNGYIGTSFRFYNPIIPATVILSGKLADVEMRGSFTVKGSAEDSATQAAKEAAAAAAEADIATRRSTDAANAATDAANAAADKVEALSTQVSEMINALRKQITSLANLVIKIQKKVKA